MRRLLLSLSLVLAACSDEGSDLVSPGTGSLDITTSTTGETTIAGYTVSLDSGAAEAIGLNGSLHRDGVDAGEHTVLLAGIPEGCTVSGENPQSVSVTAGGTAAAAFSVSCVPSVGRIDVVTATTGPGPESYGLLVDGVAAGPVASSTTRALEGVAIGSHTVGLSDLPATCQLQGENPQTVTVDRAAAAVVSFTLTCALPPGETGAVRVTTTTSGSNPDADGYQVHVAASSSQPIPVSGSITIAGLSVGAHAVQLSGLAANCSVAGENPRSATVTAGATAEVAFAVTCAAAPSSNGAIRIVTATGGTSPDPDGYTYKLDDRPPAAIGSSASVTVNDLPAGSHTVLLEGMASNCTVGGTNPRSISVTTGNTAEASFAISCEGSNAQQWSAMESNTSEDLLGVWASSGSDAFAVSPGSIFHLAGGSWSRQASAPVNTSLRAVWGSSPTDVFAVGFERTSESFLDGVILHYDGTAWTPMQPPSRGDAIQAYYSAVWGSSGSDVYAVGDLDDGFSGVHRRALRRHHVVEGAAAPGRAHVP